MKLMEWAWIFYGIAMSALGVYTFGIGLWGLIKKRPLVFASRQLMWFLLAILAPTIAMLLNLLLQDREHLGLFLVGLSIFQVGMMALVVFIIWHQMSGYMIFGVSDDTFQEALTKALNKLNLPYQETISKIRLTSIDADLQANVVSWMGTAHIRIKQWQHVLYIKDIANAMDSYYKSSIVKVNNTAFIFYLLFGVLIIVFVVFAAFSGFLPSF